MTDHDGFHVVRDDTRGVATITLDVPEKMNRVSMPAREQLAGSSPTWGQAFPRSGSA